MTVLLVGYFAVCFACVFRSTRHPDALLHFPLLTGASVLGFLAPQALGLVSGNLNLPDGAPERILFMSALCLLALLIGWEHRSRTVPPENSPTRSRLVDCYWIMFLVYLVGVYFTFKLAGLSGGIRGMLSPAGNIVFQGLPVIYLFFAMYASFTSVILAVLALRLRAYWMLAPSILNWTLALAVILVHGRRTPAFTLGVTLLSLAYFHHRWSLPRWVALFLIPAAFIIGAGAGAYRQQHEGSFTEKMEKISFQAILQRNLEGERGELYHGAMAMATAARTGTFWLGIGFYNQLVWMYVPKILVGVDGKQDLYLKPLLGDTDANPYGFRPTPGTDFTGPARVFQEFWYFGCLIYYGLGRWMRSLYEGALRGDLISEATYILILPGVVATYTVEPASFFAIFVVICPLLLIMRQVLDPLKLNPRRQFAPAKVCGGGETSSALADI